MLDGAAAQLRNAIADMGLPTGPTVTFLFTDIERSTRLERAFGSAAWATVVAPASLSTVVTTNRDATV